MHKYYLNSLFLIISSYSCHIKIYETKSYILPIVTGGEEKYSAYLEYPTGIRQPRSHCPSVVQQQSARNPGGGAVPGGVRQRKDFGTVQGYL